MSLSLREERISEACYDTDERGRRYAKGNKSHKRTNTVSFYLCEVPLVIKFIETESRTVVPRSSGEGEMGGYCLTGMESQFCRMGKFWRRTAAAAAAQQCERTYCCRAVQLKILKTATFMLCAFYHNEKIRPKKRKGRRNFPLCGRAPGQPTTVPMPPAICALRSQSPLSPNRPSSWDQQDSVEMRQCGFRGWVIKGTAASVLPSLRGQAGHQAVRTLQWPTERN